MSEFSDTQTAMLMLGAVFGLAFGLYLIARGLRGNRK